MPELDYEGQFTASYSLAGGTPAYAAVDSSAVTTGTGVAMDGALGAVVVFSYGSNTGQAGTVTPHLEESDTSASAGFGTVAAGDISGSTLTAVGVGTGGTATPTIQQYGYIGSKRWIRAGVTVTGGTPQIPVSATVVKFTQIKD